MLQDGRQGARVFARKHFLSEQTLEMLVDMRWQFACMLADSKLISGNPRSSKGRDWMDDAKQPFNVHANKQAVVCLRLHPYFYTCAGLASHCCMPLCSAAGWISLHTAFVGLETTWSAHLVCSCCE